MGNNGCYARLKNVETRWTFGKSRVLIMPDYICQSETKGVSSAAILFS